MGKIIIDDFFCTQCGSRGIPIPRRKGAERESGHLKRLFCLKCGCEINHVECRSGSKYTYDDFKLEFDYGNFDKEGQRIRTYGELKELIKNGEIEKVKTVADGRNSR